MARDPELSVEENVMQFILDLLVDGIVLSGENQRIGRTPPDKIPLDQLPTVQVFAPILDISEEAAQQPGILTIGVEISDLAGRKAALRQALEALTTTLAIDSSFNGLIRKGFIAASAVAEVGDDKRVNASATIVCQLYDKQSEGLLGVGANQSFVNLFSFADSSNFAASDAEIEDSQIVKGMMGLRRAVPSVSPIVVSADTITGALPSAMKSMSKPTPETVSLSRSLGSAA